MTASGDRGRRRDSSSRDVSLEQVLEATGLTDPDTARRYLDLAEGDSNAAVLLYLAEQEISAGESPSSPASSSSSSSSSSASSSCSALPASSSPPPSSPARTSSSSSGRREQQAGRTRAGGGGGRPRRERDVISTVSSGSGRSEGKDGESLRKPDPSYTQTLLGGPLHALREAGSVSSVRGGGGGGGDPTALCEDYDDAASFPSSLTVGSDVRSAAFAGLYEPPKELVCTLPFAKAKDLSVKTGRWLLVNIQKADVFDSHMLNRDIWRAEIVQDLIKEFFVFWQRADSTSEGKVFCELYKVATFPHIAVIDPRTGRSMKQWPYRRFSEPISAQSELFEFVEKQEELAKARQASSSSPSSGSSSSSVPSSSSLPGHASSPPSALSSSTPRGREDSFRFETASSRTPLPSCSVFDSHTSSHRGRSKDDNTRDEASQSGRAEGGRGEEEASSSLCSRRPAEGDKTFSWGEMREGGG